MQLVLSIATCSSLKYSLVYGSAIVVNGNLVMRSSVLEENRALC